MSKKLLFLFIMLTTFANVSYASFPIKDTFEVKKDTLQIETVKEYHFRMQEMGFDIQDCKCDDCKKFKGINPSLNNKKIGQNKKTNYKSLFAVLGLWLLAAIVIFVIWFLWWVAEGISNFGSATSVMT